MKDKKVCNICKEQKPRTLEFFGRDSKRKDGFKSQCKACRAIYSKKFALENPTYAKDWSLANKDYKKDYYQGKKEKEAVKC